MEAVSTGFVSQSQKTAGRYHQSALKVIFVAFRHLSLQKGTKKSKCHRKFYYTHSRAKTGYINKLRGFGGKYTVYIYY